MIDNRHGDLPHSLLQLQSHKAYHLRLRNNWEEMSEGRGKLKYHSLSYGFVVLSHFLFQLLLRQQLKHITDL